MIVMFLKFIKLISKINIYQTLYFNFHYFNPKIAIRFPFLIYKRTSLEIMKGEIKINAPIKTAMFHFGGNGLLIKDKLYSRTIWNCNGTLEINGGGIHIGRGCKINIDKRAVLTLGENVIITGHSEISCSKLISLGKNSLLSWDILVMDNDFHDIIDEKGHIINYPKPIFIDEHVWIGCRSTILKGVAIAKNNIIAANSVVTRNIKETNCIIGGVAKHLEIIKRGVEWKH